MNIKTQIAILNNEQVTAVLARELAETLELDMSNYGAWFKRNSELFEETKDYMLLVIDNEPMNSLASGALRSNKSNHVITMDMAKHIALMSKTEKGKEYRQQLIQMEKGSTQLTELELAERHVEYNDAPIFDPELINFLEQKGVLTMFLENTLRYRSTAWFKARPYETKTYFIKKISEAFMFWETPQGRDYWLALTLERGE